MFAVRLLLIFNFLGAPCFAVIGCMVLRSMSMSLTLRSLSSFGRSPVSLLIASFMELMNPALEIKESSSAVVGIRIILDWALYIGLSQ